MTIIAEFLMSGSSPCSQRGTWWWDGWRSHGNAG